MKRSVWLFLLLTAFLAATLAACGEGEPDPTRPVPSPVIATRTALPLPTATPAETATPLPTATATAVPSPAIDVVDGQTLDESGRLVVAQVVAPDGGWLVLHADAVDGPVLAAQQLRTGVSRDIGLAVDPYAATETMVAVLHADAGTTGTFEFPGPDMPLLEDDEPVRTPFSVTIDVPQPLLVVADQAVGEDGLVRVDEIVAPAPAWLVAYASEEGVAGRLLAYSRVPVGRSNDVMLRLNWRDATPDLLLALLEDAGTVRAFDADEPAVLSAGNPVTATLRASYPPDVIIYDQPVIADLVYLEQAISNGPGWVVLYFDVDGQPGNIVGFSYLEPGLNTRVPITVVTSAVTPLLHVRLHEDTKDEGEFDFPAADQPVLTPDGRTPGFSFRTDQGPFVLAAAQTVTDTVLVPLLAAATDMWVVVRADQDGQPGPVIGQIALPAGMHWDVAVPVDPEGLSSDLWLSLHQNAGDLAAFEFPDGVDDPLLLDGEPVSVPFAVSDS